MEITSKVTQVVGNGTWKKDDKTYFKWEVHMENGDIGGAMTAAQNQDKWVVGKEVTYTKNVNGQYTNFKLVEKKDFKGKYESKDQGVITMLSCISSACALYAEKGGSAGVRMKDVTDAAEMFFNIAMSKSTLPKQP